MIDVKYLARKAKKKASHIRLHFSIHKIANHHVRSRAIQWQVQLLTTSFTISLRRFKTKAANRSKLQAQLVLPLYHLPIKEIAFTSKKRRSANKKLLRAFPWLNPISLMLIVVGASGAIYFGPNVYSATRLDIKSSDTGVISTKTVVRPQAPLSMSPSTPVELKIPSIALDASIVPVAQTANGTLIPPKDYTTTGWYSGSPTPGEIGPSVIVGHVDHVGGIAVFWNLRNLQPGDEIDVIRADGTTAKFEVNALREFAQDSFPTQLVYGNTTYAGIRLITCGGVFSEVTHHYSNNIVVFGSLI